MTRWLITAESKQPEFNFGDESYIFYFPTNVREVDFEYTINYLANHKSKSKNYKYVYESIANRLNDVPYNKPTEMPLNEIKAFSIGDAFNQFIQNKYIGLYKFYDITISELEKENHNLYKENTGKRYFFCPLISRTKLYTDRNQLVAALSEKVFNILNPKSKK